MPTLLTERTMHDELVEKISELSGQNIHICMQCGTCSGSCPMWEEAGFSIRKIMHLAKFGMEEKLGNLNTFWLCASCHTCTVRCPRGIDIARVMEALRQLTLRKNINFIEPSKIPAEKIKEYPQIAMVSGFRKLTS